MHTKKTGALVLISLLTGYHSHGQQEVKGLRDIYFDYKPNILWISVEDIGCNLRCYGDSTVETPNIERLAREGVVFDNAYAAAGVCSASRSSIITGMYPTNIGTANHRTYGVEIPRNIKLFTEYLREAGYYCTNNPKEDYNFTTPDEAWDESGFTAHYYHREDKNQPFFAVYNILACHESQIWCNAWEHLTVEPDSVRVPLYFPQDNDVIKKDVARQYANIELMDLYVGQKLEMLEKQGLLDSTIVVFWSDHGGVLPREKREVTNTGLKVPMIIRFPNKTLAGTRVNELVSLMDLGPAMLSLVGIEKPDHMHGKAIAGKKKEKPRSYSYGAANRMDESYDLSRSVTDGRYRYVRNYFPEFPGFKYLQYRFNMNIMKELYKLSEQGELTGFAYNWFTQNKPVEELYDTKTDIDEVINLAGNPDYSDKLNEMRDALNKWQLNTHDVCLMPEGEIFAAQQKYNMPVSDYFDQNPEYYKRVQAIANQALFPEKNINSLVDALQDTIPSVRFWAIRGIGRLGTEGKSHYSQLITLKDDPSSSAQVSLAWTLSKMGKARDASALYKQILNTEHAGIPDEDNIFYTKVLAVNDLMYNNLLAIQLENKLEVIAENEKYILKQAAENVLEALK